MASTSPSKSSRLLGRACTFALALVVLAIGVRLTVRDDVPGLAVIFYALPPAVCGALAVLAATVAWRLGNRRVALAGVALVAVCGTLYALCSFVHNEPARPGAFRGVFWNTAHGARGWPNVAATVKDLAPDVVWLAETDDARSGATAALADAFPGRELVRTRGGLVVQTRGHATVVESTSLQSASRMALVHHTLDGREFDSLEVDVASNPFASRRPTLERVERRAAALAATPLVVLGDFNTPRDSAAFDSWRGTFSHAFESAGHGLDATWPVPFPVLSLDHVWAAGGLTIRTCELPFTWRSDHRPVAFTFDVP